MGQTNPVVLIALVISDNHLMQLDETEGPTIQINRKVRNKPKFHKCLHHACNLMFTLNNS